MKDTFGEALHSYWQGDYKSLCIITRDDGYQDKGSLEEYFAEVLSDTEAVVSSLAKGRILDVGCGAGRHVLHYQDQGFDVMGIDNSPTAIKVCKERGAKGVELMDVFDSSFSESLFDTILLFGNNVGIGGDMKGVEKLLLELRQLINEDGVLLLTSIDVTKTANETHRKYQAQNLAEGRSVGEIKIQLEYKGNTGDWFSWIHLGPEDLRKIAAKTNWAIEKIYETDGGAYSAALIPT